MDTTKIAFTDNMPDAENLSLDVESVAVQRLIDEVRSGDTVASNADYNRTYNRHNR